MKKILFLIAITLFLTACGDNNQENEVQNEVENNQENNTIEQVNNEEENEARENNEEENAVEELTREDELINFITEKVEADYNSTSIRDIRINEDLGTGEGYIVLVDLSFDTKNRPGTAKDMIEMYSSDLAATLGNERDVNQVTIFWEVPYLQESGNIAKIATERVEAGMAFTEKWFDPNIFN